MSAGVFSRYSVFLLHPWFVVWGLEVISDSQLPTCQCDRLATCPACTLPAVPWALRGRAVRMMDGWVLMWLFWHPEIRHSTTYESGTNQSQTVSTSNMEPTACIATNPTRGACYKHVISHKYIHRVCSVLYVSVRFSKREKTFNKAPTYLKFWHFCESELIFSLFLVLNFSDVWHLLGRWSYLSDKADVRLYGFGYGADLVDFEQQAVAGSLLCSFLYPLRVGHRQIVPNNLDPNLGRQAGPGLPVVLIKWVLDGDH